MEGENTSSNDALREARELETQAVSLNAAIEGELTAMENSAEIARSADDRLLAEFKRTHSALPYCIECKSIKVNGTNGDKPAWIAPQDASHDWKYNDYLSLYRGHIQNTYCRRCDPKGNHTDNHTEERRGQK